jgi:hypothetical protein
MGRAFAGNCSVPQTKAREVLLIGYTELSGIISAGIPVTDRVFNNFFSVVGKRPQKENVERERIMRSRRRFVIFLLALMSRVDLTV